MARWTWPKNILARKWVGATRCGLAEMATERPVGMYTVAPIPPIASPLPRLPAPHLFTAHNCGGCGSDFSRVFDPHPTLSSSWTPRAHTRAPPPLTTSLSQHSTWTLTIVPTETATQPALVLPSRSRVARRHAARNDCLSSFFQMHNGYFFCAKNSPLLRSPLASRTPCCATPGLRVE
jgi:hypothetical protein